MCEKATQRLNEILKRAKPEDAGRVLSEHAGELIDPEFAFPNFMRAVFREKGLRQQDVFLKADISEGYGYKLISGEKRTRRRDTLLRIFFAAGFSLEEANRALLLGGMPVLYPRFARDAVLTIAINSGIREPSAVDELLKAHGFEPLLPSRLPE